MFNMLFAMTSTLCAGRALPLPVYLKIHLVAEHVCVHVWDRGEGLRGLRPNVRRFEYMCVCLCWLYKTESKPYWCGTLSTQWQEEQLSLCDGCVCSACGGVCDRERNWPSTSWLYLLCWAQRFTVTPLSFVVPAMRQRKRDFSILLNSFSMCVLKKSFIELEGIRVTSFCELPTQMNIGWGERRYKVEVLNILILTTKSNRFAMDAVSPNITPKASVFL